MSRYLLVGDIHLSDKPPSACTEDYLDDLFTILEHTVHLESELNLDGVVWSGDVWHHKQANRTSHKTMQRAIDLVQSYKNLWIVPGNHDMAQDRYESIQETQPLGVLFKAGAKLLNGWAEGFLPDGEPHPLYGVPWQQSWTQEAVEAAFEAWHGIPDPEALPASLVIAHAPLYPPGMELTWEYYPTRDEEPMIGEEDYTEAVLGWASIQGTGYCYYGHVHEAHGMYEVLGYHDSTSARDKRVAFCNQGAITRGSLHESELNRAIAVTLWTPELGFERVDVPHKPADQVFRLMEKREKDESKVQLDEFLNHVGQATIEITSIESVIEHIRSLGLSDDVVKIASELLMGAQGK